MPRRRSSLFPACRWGGTLSAGTNNGDGTWTLTPAQLPGLTFTPPLHASGTYTFGIAATSSDGTVTAASTANLVLNIAGVADAPALSVQAATGAEDAAIALNISAALVDTDGSETLSIVIGNVPPGSVLSAGLYIGNGMWSLHPDDLAGLTITPPADYNGTLQLQVTAVSTEQDGDTAIAGPEILEVTVTPVNDGSDIQTGIVVGLEDQFIPLDIQIDVHGPGTLVVTIGNVPVGAILSAGTDNGDGTWTISAAELIGLSIRPPANSDADFTLDITATVTEAGSAPVTEHATLLVTVAGVADTPTVTVGHSACAMNDNAAIVITGALADTDGSEVLTFVIKGIPDGFALNHGHNNGDNSWTLTTADLAGLELIAPHDFQGRLHLVVHAVAHESDGDVALSAPADFHVEIGDPSLGLEINLALGIGVGIGGVQLGVGVGVGVGIGLNLGDLAGNGSIVLMENSSVQLTDAPGLLGQLALPILGLVTSVKVSGLAPGVTLSNGTYLGNGEYRLTTMELSNLYLIAAPDSDQDFIIKFEAEFLSLLPVTLDTTPVHVVGVADVPLLSVQATVGTEDMPGGIPLVISASLLDIDGSEALSLVIRDLDPGFSLNHGINNGDGTWSLTAADLTGLCLVPPKDFSGDTTYTVVAVSTERDGDASAVSMTGHVHIDGIADAPRIAGTFLQGIEDQPILLNAGVSVALADTDGSEHLAAITLSGLPAGFSLTHATDNGDGTWSIDPVNFASVQIMTPAHWHGDATFSLSVSAQENSGGPVETMAATIALHVDARADTPFAEAYDVSGQAGQAIALNLSAGLADTDGSETLSVVIGGMQDGYTLSAGRNNGDGTWTLSESQLAQVTLMLSPDVSPATDVHLTMTAYAVESSNGDHAYSATQDFTVHV